jgi:hypothetical protein
LQVVPFNANDAGTALVTLFRVPLKPMLLTAPPAGMGVAVEGIGEGYIGSALRIGCTPDGGDCLAIDVGEGQSPGEDERGAGVLAGSRKSC